MSPKTAIFVETTRRCGNDLGGVPKSVLKNKVYHVKDGAEALIYLCHRGHATAMQSFLPLILLDLKLPKLPGLRSCANPVGAANQIPACGRLNFCAKTRI